MEASAASQDVVRAKPDCNAVREQRLYDIDRAAIVWRSVLRNDHRRVADIEVHVARRYHIAVLVGDSTRRGERNDIKASLAESSLGVGIDAGVGIAARWQRDRDPSFRDESRDIVDMAVGMIVEQPRAEPHDAGRAEVPAEALFSLLAGQIVAVGVAQALLGGDDPARSVAVDRPTLEDPVGS